MSENRDPSYSVREVVGVFGSSDKLETAVENLEAAGFRREDISVMASREAVAENLNHRFESIEYTKQPSSAYRFTSERQSAHSPLSPQAEHLRWPSLPPPLEDWLAADWAYLPPTRSARTMPKRLRST